MAKNGQRLLRGGAFLPSPYVPGEVTTDLVGREVHIDRVVDRLLVIKGRGTLEGRPRIFFGPRGVGKTSLLRTIEAHAKDQGFVPVWITAGEGTLLGQLDAQLRPLSASWQDSTRRLLTDLLDSVTVSIGPVTVQGRSHKAANQDLFRRVQAVLTAAGEGVVAAGGAGLVLLIDEIQSADLTSLSVLAHAWQHLQAEATDVPLMLLGAGLSHSQDVLTDAASFAERFRFVRLGNLDEEASARALVVPAARLGVEWNRSSLQAALALAGGYPYFLQLVGDSMWEAYSPRTTADVIGGKGFADAVEDFYQQRDVFFRARWTKATEAEAQFLKAMADYDADAVPRAEIAQALDKTSDGIGMSRASLIDKGLIEEAGHGLVKFTAPGFGAYVRGL